MVGQTISHYQILEKLGEGGMGIVYKAQDTKLDRLVALKFLPRHLTANESEKVRFLQEARAASALNHPNVCTIYGIEEYEGQQFIEMEYIDGVTLREKFQITNSKPETAIAYAIQIGDALHEAHSAGIVHRDVKAENIMVNSKNQIKVMDFGLAKLKGSLKLTKTSSTVGTLAYMAPEQIQDGEVDARSDIFSFGVVLYEMLTGHLPFRGEHEAAVMYSIVNEEATPLQKELPDASSQLVHIMNRALEKDPEERYQSVHDMVIDLRRMKRDSTRVSRAAVETVQPTTQKPKRWLLAVGVALVVVAAALVVLFFNAGESIDSIAVLPFVNVGADSSTEYLSEGLTESIINNLTKVPKLRVVPRSMVFHYKGQESDPIRVGRELNVRAVVTGKTTQRGENLSIQAELVDVKEESQIWGRQYNQKLADVLSLQEDISKEVAQKLRLHLTSEEEKKLVKRPTENTEAYQLYLKGRFYWNKRTEEGMKKANDYFEQAIEKDPNFTLAYTGLADSYALLGVQEATLGGTPPKDSFAKAKAAALKAVEIDETLAEGHVSLANVKRYYDRDVVGADREYKRAIELNPNYAYAHLHYAISLVGMGRMTEALAEIKRAQELDPLSLGINSGVGWVLYFARQYNQSIEQLRKTLEMDPNFALAHYRLGLAYEQKSMHEESIAAFQKAVTLSGGGPAAIAALGHAYAVSGRKSEAHKALAELQDLGKQRYVARFYLAVVYAGLGDNDQAFAWLEKANEERNEPMFRLNFDPRFDNLHSDPRFAALLRKMGLEK